MKRYTTALSLLVLTACALGLLSGCDSGGTGGDSVEGVWLLEGAAPPGPYYPPGTYYIVVDLPAVRVYHKNPGPPNCWDVSTTTAQMTDENLYELTIFGDESTMFREGDDLFITAPGSGELVLSDTEMSADDLLDIREEC